MNEWMKERKVESRKWIFSRNSRCTNSIVRTLLTEIVQVIFMVGVFKLAWVWGMGRGVRKAVAVSLGLGFGCLRVIRLLERFIRVNRPMTMNVDPSTVFTMPDPRFLMLHCLGGCVTKWAKMQKLRRQILSSRQSSHMRASFGAESLIGRVFQAG